LCSEASVSARKDETAVTTREQVQQIEEIRTRERLSFFSSYLTLLSIVQGAALVALFESLGRMLPNHFVPSQLVMAFGLFLFIVLVWNQYQMGVTLYSWTPRLRDSLTPFVLGLCEFIAIIGLIKGFKITVLTMAVTFLLVVLAFEDQYRQVKTSTTETDIIHRIVAGFRLVDDLSCFAAALLLIATAVAMFVVTPNDQYPLYAGIVLILATIGHGIRESIQSSLVQKRLREIASSVATRSFE
jgi:hypothetical protein